ncbi:MAG: penicillin acylase family protein [Myxococcales bacterium]|nr:penicillin acylase family protein [Myxococcales bacterium]
MSRTRQIFRVILGKRAPIVGGEVVVPGIDAEVVIRRDAYGIPYIDAQNDADAWYGLGFCQGQDRGFQLEMLLRLGRGTLAQLLGPKGVGLDRLARRIGFHRLAGAYLEVADRELRRYVEAFAAGINAGIRWGSPRASHEHDLLRGRPTPWTGADVLGVLLLQSFLLASNWDIELARLKVLELDGPEALAALDPAYPEWLPCSAPPGAAAGPALDRLADDLEILRGFIGVGGGSNNWAIAGARTRSGRPIVANDPHLPPMLPAHWYLCHVRTPAWATVGATLAGAPGIAAGHNGVAAWGVTAAHFDNTDLFIVEIGEGGRSVRIGDRWVRCPIRREVIQVKGEAAVVEEVLETPHGPVIGPALQGEFGALTIQATWMRPQPIRGFLEVHRSRDFDHFREILAEWPAMPLNLVYGDVHGTIGWQLVGQVPRRRKGWGTIPLPAADPEVGWEEAPLPYAEMPSCRDPEAGYVATANNRPTPENEPFLGVDWLDGYREARISERLAARDDWDVPSTMALQVDQEVIPWRELRPLILAALADRRDLEPSRGILDRWDGVASADSAAATIYELLLAALYREIAEAKAPRSFTWMLGRGFTEVVPHSLLCLRRTSHLVKLLREAPPWFEQGWPALIADALAEVQGRLVRERGRDPSRWRWGEVRPLTLRHPVGDVKAFASIFNLGPIACGGDGNTIAQASPPPLDPLANPVAIASLRMVVEVGAWEEARFVLPGGNSGNPLSPHYRDMLPLWERGEGVPIAYDPARVREVARETLVLRPGSPRA